MPLNAFERVWVPSNVCDRLCIVLNYFGLPWTPLSVLLPHTRALSGCPDAIVNTHF